MYKEENNEPPWSYCPEITRPGYLICGTCCKMEMKDSFKSKNFKTDNRTLNQAQVSMLKSQTLKASSDYNIWIYKSFHILERTF
jgi:hypothetical protein